METVSQADTQLFLWINSWVGTVPLLDRIVQWLVSDYLIPVTYSVVLLGVWLGWQSPEMRDRHQRGVLVGGFGIGLASVAVKISNLLYFRHRPFDTYDVELLFYAPTDSSFPANPVAVAAAIATGVWFANRRLGRLMYAGVLVYGLSRIYSGVFYPLDVVAGIAIGVGMTYLGYRVLRRIEPFPTRLLSLARFLCLG